KTKYAHAAAVALATVGIACAVAAAEISPPNNDDPARSAAQESAVETRILDGHVGFYRLNDSAVLTVTRDGQQLNAHLTGHAAVPIHARSTTEFSYKDGAISFITGPDGQTASLILHQHGVDTPMTRIDAAAAQRIITGRHPGKFPGGALI